MGQELLRIVLVSHFNFKGFTKIERLINFLCSTVELGLLGLLKG